MSESRARSSRQAEPAPSAAAASSADRELIVRPEPLGGSALARALLDGRASAAWIVRIPQSPDAWVRRAEDVRAWFAERDWLGALAPALAAGGAAAERLVRVAAAGGIVVTTGQQPGLFGGPVYTWSKALTALALADAIEDATGIAAAPVFWAATDDSDHAEAQRTVVAVPGGIEILEMPALAGAGERMLADVALPDVDPLLRRLRRGAGAAVHAEVLEIAARCYVSGASVGGAYVALLRGLLEPLGIAVLDAAHPSVAAAADPVLREALRKSAAITAAVAARDAELTRHGFEPQVRAVDGLSLVFRRDAGNRTRVPLARAAQVAEQAERLGPNVLLRPIVEAAILPTVAYAAGPGELAYFAQVTAVAGALERAAPLAVPRWSALIIEPHVQRILDRYDLEVEALRDPHEAESALARAAMPASVSDALERFRRAIDELAGELREAGDSGESVLSEQVVEGHRRLLLRRVERLERRALAAVKRRQHRIAHDLATARGALFPLGQRQERVLNLLPLLARHGPLLLERMRDGAREHAAALLAGRSAVPAAR